MQWSARRFIAKNGNSYTIAIPRQFLLKMLIMRGDPVDLEFDDDTQTFTVRAAEPRQRTFNGVRASRGIRAMRP